ncbi:transposase [Streptomyces sp. NPDC091377]|uniref:transposase n=1 Tax=Streptomyces sp. NPDC091377 TaxID=3365995 RepID=UPI003823F99B
MDADTAWSSPSASLCPATATTAGPERSPARRPQSAPPPTVIADGGYRSTGLTIPHYRRHNDEELPVWKEEHNASHRKFRARVEHTFARMKSWEILRDCLLRGDRVHHAMLGVTRLYSLTLAG